MSASLQPAILFLYRGQLPAAPSTPLVNFRPRQPGIQGFIFCACLPDRRSRCLHVPAIHWESASDLQGLAESSHPDDLSQRQDGRALPLFAQLLTISRAKPVMDKDGRPETIFSLTSRASYRASIILRISNAMGSPRPTGGEDHHTLGGRGPAPARAHIGGGIKFGLSF